MGRAIPDVVRSEADKDAFLDLFKRFSPEEHMPNLDSKAVTALLARDEEQPGRVVGAIILETAPFIRGLVVDPQYEHVSFLRTLLYNVLESLLRIQGAEHYYLSCPKSNGPLIRAYTGRADEIEKDSIRFLKRL